MSGTGPAMAVRGKHHRPGTITSRHAQDQRLLKQARAGTAGTGQRPVARPPAGAADADVVAPQRPVAYTLNWSAGPEESLLRPRLPAAGELAELTTPALRALVVCTARGEPTPPALRDELLQCSPDELAAAIVEGIHRWHTFTDAGEEPRQR